VIPRLTTPRLRLRALELGDAPWVLALLTDAAFIEHIGDKGVRDLAGAERYLRDGPLAMYTAHGLGLMAVERNADGTPVGMCGLLQRPELEHPDLGYALLPSARGEGLALEACRAVMAWGQERFAPARVLGIVAPANAGSIRILESLGFRPDGHHQPPQGGEVLRYAWDAPAR